MVKLKIMLIETKLQLLITLLVLAVSCKQNSNNASRKDLVVNMDDSSRNIIDRAIAFAGGYEVWLQKKTVSFDKKSITYDSAGKVLRETNMHLDYMMKPEFKAKLTYMQNDTTVLLMHDGQKVRKLYNGKVSNEEKDIDGAWNIVFSSHYNMCMPYKLKDPGTKAEYKGVTALANGVQTQVIKITYNNNHIWYYYFEPGTGKLLASAQEGKNKWNYTSYESFEKASGLLMPAKRKGSTSDKLHKSGKPIVESENANIEFDKQFTADYFKIED
jgi:hypothetical protein